MRRLVAARLGVTIMPSTTLRTVTPGSGIVAAPVVDGTERIRVTLLHAGELASPSTQVVADAIRRAARRLYGPPPKLT